MDTEQLESILAEVSDQIGRHPLDIPHVDYQQLVGEILSWFSLECEPLIDASREHLGNELFQDSEVGLEYEFPEPDRSGAVHYPPNIGNLFIRRQREDRSISINIEIHRYGKDGRASINMQLDICEESEKGAFRTLFNTYRRPLQRLLNDNQLHFITAYKSESVGKYRGSDNALKIDEYLSDPDATPCFSLGRAFSGRICTDTLRRTFLLLSAIYASCRDDLSSRKNLDRFATYSAKIQ